MNLCTTVWKRIFCLEAKEDSQLDQGCSEETVSQVVKRFLNMSKQSLKPQLESVSCKSGVPEADPVLSSFVLSVLNFVKK